MPVTTDATPLRAARLDRGWSQPRAVSALASAARARGINIAETSSLKTMLSRWENGAGRPDMTYQKLFCDIYETDPDELGFATDERPGPSLRTPPVLDEFAVSYFRDVLDQHVRADNLMGPHWLVDVVKGQTQLLDQVLSAARPRTRRELTRLAWRYHELTGWLCQDAGDPRTALYHTDRATDYAMAHGSPSEVAYLLMRKTNIACDLHNPAQALSFGFVALRHRDGVAPRIRALNLVQRARAHALVGDRDDCARTLDHARTEIARPAEDADELAAYCTPEYIDMESAVSWISLGQPERAIPVLERAVTAWPAELRRDLGMCQSRLAVARASIGDVPAACQAGVQAVATAAAATSVRTLKELNRLRALLAPWRKDTQVSDLTEHIRRLTRTS